MPEYARRAALKVTIDGHDATDYMAPSLLDFTYVCNAGGKADEVQITLHNRDGRWSGDWKPKKGMPVQAEILCADWEEPGENLSLPCGSFAIDEITFSGPPDRVEIKAVSADLTGGLRDTQKTRAWENTSLRLVGEEIAGEYGLSLFYSGDAHEFLRQDQRNEGDLAFLNRLASQFGMSCKAHDGKLVIFDREQAEGQAAGMSIAKAGGQYSPQSYSFRESSSNTGYDKACAAYTDPRTGTTHKAEARAQDMDGGKTLTLQNRAESPAQAAKMARAALHDKNSRERTASVEIMGCPALVAGQTVALEGFGDFSATYFIKTATHRISGSGGYSTSLELSRPCPTLEAGASEEVCVAALAAKNETSDTDRLNREADARARDGFEELLERLPEILQPVEELLLCLPEIAAAEAARAADKADRQGWEYLEKMFYRWLGGKANKDGNSCPDVFWIDRNWVLQFPKAKEKYEIVKQKILSENAKLTLVERLQSAGYLSDKREHFDFISDPFIWIKYYHQSQKVEFSPFDINAGVYITDPLYRVFGDFDILGMARGWVEPLQAGGHRIYVQSAGVAVRDSFNFEDEFRFNGFWSCINKSYLALIPGEVNAIFNFTFNNFREKYGNGNDFLVATEPELVDLGGCVAYDTSL